MLLALLLCCRALQAPEPAPSMSHVPAPQQPSAPVSKPAPAHIYDAKLRGICDGSAAIALDQGWLIAYDEGTTVHHFGDLGHAGVAIDLGPQLGTDEELDLEGAARIDSERGPIAWWVGSHGRDGDDEVRPARRMLFATDLPADLTTMKVIEGPIDLVPALTPHLDANAWTLGAKKGGLNIEGLAEHPDGGLVLGLRGPLGDGLAGNALLVRLDATHAVASVHEIDLGGRGFRDLVWTGDRWLAIAGPVGKGDDFRLFSIDRTLEATPFGQATWTENLRPEAIVRWGTGWMLLSDDGKVERPDDEASDGLRTCDKIRKKRGPAHPEVHLRLRTFPAP